MTFEIDVSGRPRTVSIERTDRPGRFRVSVDDEMHLLDVARTGEYGLSLMGTVPLKGTVPFSFSSELQVVPGGRPGELLVTLEGRAATVLLNGRRAGHRVDGAAPGHGELSIVAPMPGRVVRVLVAAGDEVDARQAVVVVEAMKMENELRAPRAGRVKEISVAPGTAVEAGRILAVIE